jgi:hypothetical protein
LIWRLFPRSVYRCIRQIRGQVNASTSKQILDLTNSNLTNNDYIIDGPTKFLQSINKMDMLEGLATPAEAALTPLFAATHPIVWKEKEKYGGAYLVPFDVLQNPSEAARNEMLARELWEVSERVVQDVLGD